MKQAIILLFCSASLFIALAAFGNKSLEKAPATPQKLVHNIEEKLSKTFAINNKESVINWVATKTGGLHTGTLAIKKGKIEMVNGKLTGGSFVLDMTSITVTDLTGEMKDQLEGHLKTVDFFAVDKFPEGSFYITKVEGNSITGNLTLKGFTLPVSFLVEIDANKKQFKATTPAFMINRHNWDISYQSKMKDVVIDNEISIQINLVN